MIKSLHIRTKALSFSAVLLLILIAGCKKDPNYVKEICKSRHWTYIDLEETHGPWLDTVKNSDTTFALRDLEDGSVAVLDDVILLNKADHIMHIKKEVEVMYGVRESTFDYYIAADSIVYTYQLHVNTRTESKKFLTSHR
jgi:hypothetical protein